MDNSRPYRRSDNLRGCSDGTRRSALQFVARKPITRHFVAAVRRIPASGILAARSPHELLFSSQAMNYFYNPYPERVSGACTAWITEQTKAVRNHQNSTLKISTLRISSASAYFHVDVVRQCQPSSTNAVHSACSIRTVQRVVVDTSNPHEALMTDGEAPKDAVTVVSCVCSQALQSRIDNMACTTTDIASRSHSGQAASLS